MIEMEQYKVQDIIWLYLVFNNRWQVCWSTFGTVSNNGDVTKTFPLAFKKCAGVLTCVTGSAGYNPTFSAYSVSATSFKVHLSSTDNGGGSRNGYYLAYGY